MFSNNDLLQIVEKAELMKENPTSVASLQSFVSLHKVFLVACVSCLFHADNRFLEDGQLSLDALKRTTLCNDCLRCSHCCPFCQSLNREVSLEKRRENTLLLKAIEVKINLVSGKKYLSVTYPFTCDPEVAYHPSKLNMFKLVTIR